MRDAFIRELTAQALMDDRIMLVVGDLGYGVVDEFAQRLPRQFVNAGIAEQSMIGLAAGLAAAGYRVFVYSIANFPTMRCLEQIRNDVCYHQRNVTVVSVGAGVAYGSHGYTHHAVEDVAVMRAIAGIRVLSPADPAEAVAAARFTAKVLGPSYVRLGKNGEKMLHAGEGVLDISQALVLRSGVRAVIACTGAIAGNCILAAEILGEMGVDCSVLSLPTVKPMPVEWLRQVPESVPIVTVEEHGRAGGFGAAVLETANDHALKRTIRRVALDEANLSNLGSQDHLRTLSGLDAPAIADVVLSALSQSDNRLS